MRFSFRLPLRPLLLLATLLLSVTSHLFAQAPAWQDASSPSPGIGYSTAIDAVGNTYVTGTFEGTATFGTITLTSTGGEDVFVAKRTPAGAWLWATRAGSSGSDRSLGLAVDGSGSAVVTGSFTSPTIAFGAATLTNAGRADLFVAKLTPTGAWLWATGAGGTDDDYGNAVALDSNDNPVITSFFQSPAISFGSTTLTNASTAGNLFVAKLTPAGAWLWATGAGGTDYDAGYGVAVDGNDNVVVTGNFTSPTITFGATTLTNTGVTDLFVAKLTPTGAWLWATRAGSSGADEAAGLALDGSGNVVVSGAFDSPTIAFGTTTLTNANAGKRDLFVAKLTSVGAWDWATGAGGSAEDYGIRVAAAGSGSVVVIGLFGSPAITFGTTTLANAGAFDLFVAELTPAGAWLWATGTGSSGNDVGYGLALDGSGNVVVSGYFTGPTIAFGATTLTNPNPGSAAIFLARLSGVTGWSEAEQPLLTQPLTLAPNPARTTVQLSGGAGPAATLLDARGRLVSTVPLTPAGAATLDVRALPAGLYVLRAGRQTRRLVVE